MRAFPLPALAWEAPRRERRQDDATRRSPISNQSAFHRRTRSEPPLARFRLLVTNCFRSSSTHKSHGKEDVWQLAAPRWRREPSVSIARSAIVVRQPSHLLCVGSPYGW